MTYSIGVDIGGTNTVIGLLDPGLQLVNRTVIPTRPAEGADMLFDRIAASISGMVQEAGVGSDGYTVGMGVPGFVNSDTGISMSSGNLGWIVEPVAAKMQARLQAPVAIDNDVRMYVYGESLFGAGQGVRYVLGVTVGTGLASAFVADGQPFSGGGYMAGELGHIIMEDIPYRCICGMIGCLETVASATGIVRQARELMGKAGKPSILHDWFPDDAGASLTARDVSRAYDLDDPIAIRVFEQTGEWLGRGLTYAVTLFSPDRVIIGGGAAAAGERLLGPVRRTMKRMLISDYWEHIKIVPASLGDDAGVIGSAVFGRNRVHNAPLAPGRSSRLTKGRIP